MPEKEKGVQRLRRANTDGKVAKTERASVPPRAPFDPWASDSEDDSAPKPNVRRKLPKKSETEVPAGRPNPLLANQRKTLPEKSAAEATLSDRALGSRSPSRPNPLLPSSRSPSTSRPQDVTPRAERPVSRKRTDGSPRTPETTDPAVYLQSLLQETPTVSPECEPSPPTCARTQMRHKGVARSLSRLYSDEEPKEAPPRQEAKKREEKPRGRSGPPSRRTELKAVSEAAGGGLPVGKGRKAPSSRPRKVPKEPKESTPEPQRLGQSQESFQLTTEPQLDLGSSQKTNELMTTFGDDISFTNDSPKEPASLEVPHRAFGQKVYSFGEDICHKLDRGWSALQEAAPAENYDFQKPLKGKAMVETILSKDGSSRTPSTHVRLPRLAELLRSKVDRSLRPVAEYGELLCFLQAQMVLGHSWTSDASPLSILCALLQWFLPYIVLLSGLLAVAIATLGPLEAFLALLPLPLLLPLQQLRCRAWNRQLLGAVDKAAMADICDQLRAPLGWGEDGQVFSANLSAGLQALSLPPGELLASAPQRFHWLLYLGCSLVLLLPLSLSLEEVGDLTALTALLVCAVAMLVACSPSREMQRAQLVDLRLEALEAAMNAMLDTLRPLLGPTAAASRMAKAHGLSQERFSVRMITSERLTLRGTLSVLQEECSLRVRCPLGSFDLVAKGLESAAGAELGRCAAGEVDTLVSPPRSGWVSSLQGRFGRATERRRDDDLASVSTASTLTRSKTQVDEASLHLALAMVTALSRRRAEPLEVFFAKKEIFLAPPKASYDEPAIILSVAEDQLTCYAGFGRDSGCRLVPRITKDRFGVVRDPTEMRQLCTDEEGPLVGSSSRLDDSPHSDAASQGSDSEDEGKPCGEWPSSRSHSNGRYGKLFAAPRHLALVFDTFAARDQCLELIRETLPPARTKCFPASE